MNDKIGYQKNECKKEKEIYIADAIFSHEFIYFLKRFRYLCGNLNDFKSLIFFVKEMK